MSILVVFLLGVTIRGYTAMPWYVALSLAAFLVAFGLAGQLILFSLTYKGYERWYRRSGKGNLPSLGTFASIIMNGYTRALYVFLVVVLVLSFFHPSFMSVVKVFGLVFAGINIFTTFLSSHMRTWNEDMSVPHMLCIGFGIQLVFLLIVKLL